MQHILIINGPNLNLLGEREPHIYGSQSFDTYYAALQQQYAGVAQLSYVQSNVEGELINTLQAYRKQVQGMVFNPGGYSHTSVALADAVASISVPVIEVHISNVHARESFRQHLLIAPKCLGIISGLGLDSYRLAVDFLLSSRTSV